MEIKRQIEKGILVSPVSQQSLKFHSDEWLITESGEEKYQ